MGREAGGVQPKRATDVVSELISADNLPYLRARSARLLRNVSVLFNLGLATRPDTALYRIVASSGDTLEVPIPASSSGEVSWVEAAAENLPLYRTRSDENFWYEFLADSRTQGLH